MNQQDDTRGTIPARTLDLIPASQATAPRGFDEIPRVTSPPIRSRKLSAGLAWRGLRRYWWQAAMLWMAGSAGLAYLAHSRVKPTFEASSTIRVEPGAAGQGPSAVAFEVFKQTQVNRATNPNVIASAMAAHPELPRIARSAVSAQVVPGTNLIQVSTVSESAEEAAGIVNAVVEAYLKVALDGGEELEERCRRLREVKQERTLAVDRKREAIASQVARHGAVDAGQARDRNSAALEQYRVLSAELLEADLKMVEARAKLDMFRAMPETPAPPDPSRPSQEAVFAFYAAPQVVELQSRISKANESLIAARDADESTRAAIRKSVDDLQRQKDLLWSRLGPGLIQASRVSDNRQADSRAAEVSLAALKARAERLDERLERLNAQTKSTGADELGLEFARQDLNRAEAVLDSVTRSLDQAEFEAREPVARFRAEYHARASDLTSTDRRVQVMAAAPLGMLLGLVGLMAFLEFHAARVANPDDVPSRLQLAVLGVVPPLPRSVRGRGLPAARENTRARRELDQFVQSLDHLRVAICSGKDQWGRPLRSVLITSACGGEGKTTLAAQLAERCVSAGLLTLLVDADIRNPSLSRMFDLATSTGLANVLRGESMAEEAITVIGGAGGFHFLPAGSPRVDPGRLLHGDRMSKLLASARESFDLVIVDSPPVLPVPDALTIGQWVDGVVLAVRHDTSRFPLVDRANRRLAAVGVPVIGAIINGIRSPDAAYYGSYAAYGSTDDDSK